MAPSRRSSHARVRALVQNLAGSDAGDAVRELTDLLSPDNPSAEALVPVIASEVLQAGALQAIVKLVQAPDGTGTARCDGMLLLSTLSPAAHFRDALLRH